MKAIHSLFIISSSLVTLSFHEIIVEDMVCTVNYTSLFSELGYLEAPVQMLIKEGCRHTLPASQPH